MEEAGERDSGDREKNRLTSLHLIGSSCNRREKNNKKRHGGQGKKETTDDRKQSETRKKRKIKTRHETARHREGKRTAPQRLAVRDD